jgi:hypothetical protein
MQSYKSRVLNLYNAQNEGDQFRIEPSDTKVTLNYNAGGKPVDFQYLTVQDVDVHAKMFENSSAIGTESSRAQASENSLAADLESESERAAGVESGIQSELTTEKARLSTQEAHEAQELANEVATRLADDLALGYRIDNETNARTAADTKHTTDIADEIKRAGDEESRIEQRLDMYRYDNDVKVNAGDAKHDAYETYANARMADIESKSSSDGTDNSNAVAAEAKARADEISRLDGRIDFITNNVDGAAIDSLNELLGKFNEDGLQYVNRLSALEAVIHELVNQLG